MKNVVSEFVSRNRFFSSGPVVVLERWQTMAPPETKIIHFSYIYSHQSTLHSVNILQNAECDVVIYSFEFLISIKWPEPRYIIHTWIDKPNKILSKFILPCVAKFLNY